MTEDTGQGGGLTVVLAKELERYGLPEEAGLTGLLRHIRNNADMTIGLYKLALIEDEKRRTAILDEIFTEDADLLDRLGDKE